MSHESSLKERDCRTLLLLFADVGQKDGCCKTPAGESEKLTVYKGRKDLLRAGLLAPVYIV